MFGNYLLFFFFCVVFFQAEDGIRDLVRSRGLGDVYKRQMQGSSIYPISSYIEDFNLICFSIANGEFSQTRIRIHTCLLYTSDAADERSSVDLGGRRIIKKKTLR